MKKIAYLLLTLVIGFGMTSCYDDDPINLFPAQGVQGVAINVSAANSVTGEGFGVPFTVSIPTTFADDAVAEARLTIDGGIVNSNVTIPAGQTSASGSVSLNNDNLNKFDGKDVSLKVTGLAVPDQVFNITSNEVIIRSFDRVQWPYGAATIAGRMTALFDWENSGANDLDMYMFNADTGDLVEAAATGSRWETDIFNDTHPDGNYVVDIDFWVASGDLPWKIFFVHPDQETITSFEGVFANAQGGDYLTLINFTKSTDGSGNVSYTFSQP